MRRITSRQNPLVARFRAAARGETSDLLLLDGIHLLADALAAGIRIEDVVVASSALDESDPDLQQLLERLARAHVDPVAAPAPVMAALSPVRSSSVVVALAERPRHDNLRASTGAAALVVVAVDVQDPGNVGAVVRVSEAGGATGVMVAGASANPFGWKALRGSMGSALRLPVETMRDADAAVAEIRRRGHRIITTVPRGGKAVFDVDYTGAIALLIGGEGHGLPPALLSQADERVTIPMQPPVESLNTAVTAAIIVYEAYRQRHENLQLGIRI